MLGEFQIWETGFLGRRKISQNQYKLHAPDPFSLFNLDMNKKNENKNGKLGVKITLSYNNRNINRCLRQTRCTVSQCQATCWTWQIHKQHLGKVHGAPTPTAVFVMAVYINKVQNEQHKYSSTVQNTLS